MTITDLMDKWAYLFLDLDEAKRFAQDLEEMVQQAYEEGLREGGIK